MVCPGNILPHVYRDWLHIYQWTLSRIRQTEVNLDWFSDLWDIVLVWIGVKVQQWSDQTAGKRMWCFRFEGCGAVTQTEPFLLFSVIDLEANNWDKVSLSLPSLQLGHRSTCVHQILHYNLLYNQQLSHLRGQLLSGSRFMRPQLVTYLVYLVLHSLLFMTHLTRRHISSMNPFQWPRRALLKSLKDTCCSFSVIVSQLPWMAVAWNHLQCLQKGSETPHSWCQQSQPPCHPTTSAHLTASDISLVYTLWHFSSGLKRSWIQSEPMSWVHSLWVWVEQLSACANKVWAPHLCMSLYLFQHDCEHTSSEMGKWESRHNLFQSSHSALLSLQNTNAVQILVFLSPEKESNKLSEPRRREQGSSVLPFVCVCFGVFGWVPLPPFLCQVCLLPSALGLRLTAQDGWFKKIPPSPAEAEPAGGKKNKNPPSSCSTSVTATLS